MTEPNPELITTTRNEDGDDASSDTQEQSNAATAKQQTKAKHHGHYHFLPNVSVLKSSTRNHNHKSTATRSGADVKDPTDAKDPKGKSGRGSILPNTDPFMVMRKSADKKVVGLKEFGISKSMKNVRKNEWLSASHSFSQQLNHESTGDIPPNLPPLKAPPSPCSDPGSRRMVYSAGGEFDPAKAMAFKNPAPHIPSKVEVVSKEIPPPISTLPTPRNIKRKSVEELEERARRKSLINPLQLLWLGNIAALKVMGFYLITLETFITCGLTVGMTIYWYNSYYDDDTWRGGGLDFVLLAFAVTSPISAAIGMAFQRRERALIAIADFRSFSYHLFMAHCLWDWPEGGEMGREKAQATNRVDWVEHCDAVLAQLTGIADELSRFLTLPTASRSRHRMTRSGRHEAARTMEVAYYLLESMTTQRMTRLIKYSERLKKTGLPSGEVSRMRQYERFLSDIIEQLRMVKLYRTPQALRSFARIFTILLPPFYAPNFAQVAKDVDSLPMGIAFGIITALGLTALFESLQVLEDPFTAFLALDGIDAREEFEVLHFSQLTNARRLVFPDAPEFPAGRRAALTRWDQREKQVDTSIGLPTGAAVGVPSRSPSVRSGITMDETNHHQADSVAPAGDDTVTTTRTTWRNTPYTEKTADAEFGPELPITEITMNRESVFDEHRAMFPEDESGHKTRRHNRNISFWSLESVGRTGANHSNPASPGETPAPIGLPASETSAAVPEGDASTLSRKTTATAYSRHRRTQTSLSAAGLFPGMPDF